MRQQQHGCHAIDLEENTTTMPESRRGATTAPATPEPPKEITRTFWPPSDWSVRRKVIACLALPLVFATVLVGVRIGSAWSDASAASQAEQRYQVLEPAIDYLASSQDLSAQLVNPKSSSKTEGAARARFHQSRDTLSNSLGSAGLSDRQHSLLRDAINTGKNLDSATNATSESAASLAPGAISSDVLAFVDDLDTSHADPTLSALHDLVTAQSHLADQRLELSAGTDLSSALRIQLSADVGGERDALERVQSAHLPGVDVSSLQSDTVSRLTFSTDGTLSQLKSVTKSVTSSYRPAYKAAVKVATQRVSAQADDARRSALLQVALVIALLVLTGIIVVLLSQRLLVRPITGLRRDTLDIAQKHLPATIDRVQSGQGVGRIQSIALTSREEIGQLSRAVDDMQNRAIRLASEQATLRRQMTDMFETLSRRSTSLVNQQLNLLDQLERTEDDPKRLDSLFRLDHMAARMRRNGQSLMVLAGNDARGGRSESLPLDQVIGTAVSEVEGYQRVDVGGLPEHIVDASAAGDLVHIVSELVDNALSYSPPDSRVGVSGTRAIDGGVLLEIEDHGLGIDKDELAELNENIFAGGRFSVETTRHMGLFVVARLSANHEIEVRLRSRLNRGTVAAVHIPVSVLSDQPVEDLDVTTRQTLFEQSPETSRDTADASADTAGMPAAGAAAGALAGAGVGAGVATATLTAYPPASASEPVSEPDPTEQTSAGLPRRRPGATGVTALTGTDSLGSATSFTDHSGPQQRDEWVSPVAETSRPAKDRAGQASAFFSARQAAAAEQEARTSSGLPQRRPGATQGPWADQSGPASTPDSTPASTLNSTSDSAPPPMPASTPPRPRPPEDTPIFQQISSRWLDADGGQWAPWSSEPTDHAWEAAHVATEEHFSDDGALPRREPGRFVVPGSIETPGSNAQPSRPTRDPEELRAKLSRYKAGVERAREASATDNNTANNAGSGADTDTDYESRRW